MLEAMLAHTRVRACMAAGAATMLLAACGVPPLHRSVVVETNPDGVPVHASGKVDNDGYTVMRGDTLYSIAFRANVDFHQLAAWNGISAPYVIHPGQRLRLTRPDNVPATQPQVPVFHTVASADHAGGQTEQEPSAVFETVPSQPAGGDATAAASTSASAPVSAPTPAGGNGTPSLGPAVPASTVVAVAGEEPVATPKPKPEPAPSTHVGATHAVGGITWSWPAKGKVVGRFHASDAIPGINIAGNSGDPVRAAADGVVVYSGNGLVGYGELIIIKHNDDYLSAYGHNSKRLVKEGEHVKAGQEIARMGSGGGSGDALEFQVRYKGKPVDPLKYLPAG